LRVTYHLEISGLVQGVGFRASMREVALGHALDGWVKNSADGSVEALVQGEREAVAEVIEWAKVGPPGAQVRSVKSLELKDHPRESGFDILVPDWTGSANR
jgi:acylphosphatase